MLQKDEKDINAKTIKKIILFVNLSKKFEHNSEKKNDRIDLNFGILCKLLIAMITVEFTYSNVAVF